MDEMSCDEYGAIEELRKRLESILPPNMYDDIILFYRFLKARNFDIDAAESMLRKHITWRKLYQYENILEDFKPMEVFRKCIDPSIIGFSKDRSLVIYIPCGKLDTAEIDKCMPMHKYLKHWAWVFEKCLKYIKQTNDKIGKDTLKMSVILDCDKVTFANVTNRKTSQLYIDLTNMLQNNFPETMKAIYIINAQPYAMVVLRLAKLVMSGEMLKKIYFYGYSGWKEKLLDAIDADILPAFLGGNLTDPDSDPLCKTFIQHCGTIPSKYFSTPEERFITPRPGLKKVNIPNGGKKEIGFKVDERGSLIQWAFIAKTNIGFGLFLESSEHREEIIPVVRYDTSDRAEKDYCRAACVGKYIVLFDNSYSWMTPKDVEYYVEVLKPEI